MPDEEQAILYMSSSSAARVDYRSPSKTFFCEIERVDGGVLQTFFDGSGAVVRRNPLPISTDIAAESERLAKSFGCPVVRKEYSKVLLDKPCPKCYSSPLAEQPGPKMVMPIYICKHCGSKSFFLTDQYLIQLVSENKSSFSESERAELSSSPDAFFAELREYIIRIFASKKIIAIK
ncbi:MAG: hypothetical protein QXN59_00275 [Candidatus Micrarchaeaceae archaeon]